MTPSITTLENTGRILSSLPIPTILTRNWIVLSTTVQEQLLPQKKLTQHN